MGLAAHKDLSAREQCPFPLEHVEARRWLAGWDHADRDRDTTESDAA
jgi:ribosome modulation factor